MVETDRNSMNSWTPPDEAQEACRREVRRQREEQLTQRSYHTGFIAGVDRAMDHLVSVSAVMEEAKAGLEREKRETLGLPPGVDMVLSNELPLCPRMACQGKLIMRERRTENVRDGRELDPREHTEFWKCVECQEEFTREYVWRSQ
jgi:hypothetical protein